MRTHPPHAAQLLLEFLLSDEGQKIFQQNNFLPALPEVFTAMVAGLPCRPTAVFKANFMQPE